LLPILGERVSHATVIQIGKRLGQAVQTFYQRLLLDVYAVLLLDGLVMKRRTGVGVQKHTVLVALGIKPDGKREVIDFRQVHGES
jgi:transposase-like protein